MARTTKKKPALTPEEKLEQALVPEAEQPYKVPENWCWVKLGHSADIIMGQSPEGSATTDDPTYMPLIGGAADMGELYPKVSRYTKSPTKISSTSDIILCIRATLGQAVFSDGEYCLGRGVAAVRSGILFRDYIRYGFINFEQYLYDNATGTTFAQVSSSTLQKMPFPLPPLPEQHRIVTRIESLFAKLDEAREKAQAVVDGAKERKTSLLFQAFTGKLTEKWRAQNEGKYSIDDWLEYEDDVVAQSECPTDLPASWKWIRMGAVGYTNIGLTYSPSDKSDDGIIVLRSSNIQNGKMDYEDIVRVNMSIPDNKMCRKGDLLICARNGSKALVGKTAVVDADGMSYGAFMAIFRSVYNPYIYYFLSSPFFRDLIDKDVGTTTINQVTQAIIKNLPLPFAPKEEQNEVVRVLSGLLDKEDTIIETATRAINQIEGIKKSILARAFRGELGTNDPEEESAAELVRRVL